uniref:Leukocyte receptor cluster member 4 n=1 Tax=Mandrillus leucophaeus TaxID=9568 RepID=A0A2K5XZ72_MANLE
MGGSCCGPGAHPVHLWPPHFAFSDHHPWDLGPHSGPALVRICLASEVQDLHLAQRKEMTSGFNKGPTLGLLPDVPSLMETLSYSYCYMGIMTGEWACPTALSLRHPECLFCVPAVREDAFYCGCIAAGFGAYPVAAKTRARAHPPTQQPPPPRKVASLEYDYETIRNVDCYGTDFCMRVRDGMRYWNMTVQWWLAQYIYKSAPARSYVLQSAWTMLLSTYWHGLHPGYYLSFLTIPLCLAAEGQLESVLWGQLSPGGQKAWDWVHWFLKMRAYDYMCTGFVLLSLADTLWYWASIYFCIHFLALAALGLGLALGGGSPSRRKAASHPTSLAPEKLWEE